MSICKTCGQEMNLASGCTLRRYANEKKDRLPYMPEDPERNPRCHDCGVQPGQFHHPGCDMEECPDCGGQLITCSCSHGESA
jgi:hypothetical protein